MLVQGVVGTASSRAHGHPRSTAPLLSVDTATRRTFSTKGQAAAAMTTPCSADLQAKTVRSVWGVRGPSCGLCPSSDAPARPSDSNV